MMKRKNRKLKNRRRKAGNTGFVSVASVKALSVRLFKIMPVLVTGIAVVYGLMFLKDLDVPTMLPLEHIEVAGELKFLDDEKVTMQVKNNISGGYFSADLHGIREVLLQNPWVKSVSLRRQWPESITVTIEEQEPVAYWNDDSYINASGEVFTPAVIDRGLNLPVLNGPEGHHDNVWKFMNVLYQEMALLDVEVVRLDLDDRRAWQLVISTNDDDAYEDDASRDAAQVNNKIDVRLGRFETEKRLRRFIRILPALAVTHHAAGDAIETIDMRYPNGFAVRMKDNNADDIAGGQRSLTRLSNTHKFAGEEA
ncbi:MAG: cell division protein FtsQ/DivIB [Proteobacteria bacterium]|nr:cell division protein FtsQ/DivIB [Pseudomonadota bacterium]